MPSRADASPSHLWVAELPEPGGTVVLDPPARHYLSRVCRARAGDLATLTDGRGGVARARLVEAARGELAIETVERHARPRVAWLLCGAPEGERGDWLVEKVAELGLAVLQPVNTERASWREGGRRHERWVRLARAALGQSLGAFMLEIREPVALAAALQGLSAGARRFATDRSGARLSPESGGGGASVGLVGPSPGWTAAEDDLISNAGFERIRLSEHRLRTETAALSWVAWWSVGGA